MNKRATELLNNLKRIDFSNLNETFNSDVVLYEEDSKLEYEDNDKVYANNCSHRISLKDLLRVIKIIDPLSVTYESTNILTPRLYAENSSQIPQHISIQCLMFNRPDCDDLKKIKDIIQHSAYGKTDYDKMWIGLNKEFDEITTKNVLYILNRRVGGWDGSINRPVIELLCTGGHLPTVWDEKNKCFRTLEFLELLTKECNEELGIDIGQEQFKLLGGFHNKVSNELVVLYCIFVSSKQLFDIIDNSKNNIGENIDGIYLGEFDDVIELYNFNASVFAGGEKARNSNFPTNKKLMKRIKNILSH